MEVKSTIKTKIKDFFNKNEKYISICILKKYCQLYNSYRHFKYCAKWRVDENSIMLASFPRCGNSWIRFLLSSLFYSIETGNLIKLNFDTIYNYIPTLIQNDNKKLLFVFDDIHLIKTHSNYYHPFKRAIILYRKPVDSIISYYILETLEMGEIVKNVNIDLLFRIKRYIDFHKSWLRFIKDGNQNILINYDTLVQDTEGTLNRVLKFLNLKVDVPLKDLSVLYKKHDISTKKELEDKKEEMKKTLSKFFCKPPIYIRWYLRRANELYDIYNNLNSNSK